MFWYAIFVICEIIGSYFLFYLCLVAPCVFCMLYERLEHRDIDPFGGARQGPMGPSQIDKVIGGLTKLTYDPEKFDDGKCSICYEDYNLDDEITELKCKHYFHLQCLV